MRRRTAPAAALASAGLLALGGCATYPVGPGVTALPGRHTSFEQFQHDDAECRDWAAQRIGVSPDQAAADAGVASAAIGTLAGALAGTAIGAVAGNPAAGAAIGAGGGLLIGSAAGAEHAYAAGAEAQRHYDTAYVQCMYAKGNRVPARRRSRPPEALPPARDGRPIPPPPPGRPPPPPPGIG